jgi:hypothetical protein
MNMKKSSRHLAADIPYLESMKVLNANKISNINPYKFLFIFHIDPNFDSYEITTSILLLLLMLRPELQH